MQEAAYMFAELKSMGAPMSYLDVGGGLAIDYDGSKTDSTNSLSYTTQQYANDVVATIKVRRMLRNNLQNSKTSFLWTIKNLDIDQLFSA